MTDRALATIETILDVQPIPDADTIDVATVRGWKVVVKKGEFKVGDSCIYFEIDSFLPHHVPAFSFLESRGSKEIDGVKGHVLRTVKLRGQFSQGLILSLDEFNFRLPVGTDVTQLLGVVKYEPPIPASISGQIVGAFPTQYARKTDAERIQNLTAVWDKLYSEGVWYATEKIDGTSCTILCDENGLFRVMGRNWEYKENDKSTLWKLARKLDEFLQPNTFVQGEVYGEGIQGNPLKITGQQLSIFTMGANRIPLARCDWPDWALDLAIPLYDIELPPTINEAIEQADGIKSLRSPGLNAEGIVWHEKSSTCFAELDGYSHFKVISNRYLLKHQD